MASHPHVPGCARLNVMRLNAARLNVYEPILGGVVDGVERSGQFRIAGAGIVHALNDAPDTAQLRVDGFVPVAGQAIAVYHGDRSTSLQLFGGRILETTVLYEGKAENVATDVRAIDATWLLNRRRVLARYVATAADWILTDILGKFATGTVSVMTIGSPMIDEITFTNDTIAACFTAVCERIGASWLLDYGDTIRVFYDDAVTANAITDADGHGASDLTLSEDLSQVVTRVIARGGAGAVAVDVAAGATEIPVRDDGWFSLAGGVVEVAAQRVTYTGVQGRGATGALVGTLTTPTSPLRLAPTHGAGLTAGVYQYAETLTSASGETLPGPVTASTVTGAAVPDLFKTSARAGANSRYVPQGMVDGGRYSWRIAVVFTGGGYVLGPPTDFYTVNDHEWEIYVGIAVIDPTTGFYYNPGIMTGAPANILETQIYRTTNGGSTWYREVARAGALAGFNGWYSGLGVFYSDQGIATASTYPTGPIATLGVIRVLAPRTTPTGQFTGTKLYRTAANGSQLKLLATNPNPANDYTDTTADAALGANVPTTDTAGVPPSNAQVPVGAIELPVTSINPFTLDGGSGWVEVNTIPIRYSGTAAGKLTGIPAVGLGSLTATVRHGAQVLVLARLVGIPASGTGALTQAVKTGDPVTLRIELDNLEAQTALGLRFGGGATDGVVEEPFSDSRMTAAELTSYGLAILADRKDPRQTLRFITRDPTCEAGRLITVSITAPPIAGTFRIHTVTFDEIAITGGLARVLPRRTVEASNKLFTFADLVRRMRGREGGAF